jgi:maltooligosyltrehalose trehalohydrolase
MFFAIYLKQIYYVFKIKDTIPAFLPLKIMRIGASYLKNHTGKFIVWAPSLQRVSLKITFPEEQLISMTRDERGYWHVFVKDVKPPLHYFYVLEDEKDRPDPASHFQPEGVHKASQLIDHAAFKWQDSGWQGIDLADMIMYELHIGTFSPEGTFDAVIPRLDEIRDIGVNAIEIMPVAQFPGKRNWGYDGVYPFAVQNSYGGPDGLKRLVDECHKKGMAVILDVVYNHLGPEGNYLWDYGPYFTDRYKTPWGQAINFDGPHSNEVRNFFTQNALSWFLYYHIDALRLDAIHGIYDLSAIPFLLELTERVEEFSKQQGRKFYLIAESDLNNAMVIRERSRGGYGIDALWCDDFHHSVHTLLTDEADGYYIDFGRIEHIVKSFREGHVYSGQYSNFRKRNHGNSSKDINADQFIVFSQNHDQAGNRLRGARLSCLVSFEAQKLAAGLVILSPYIPLLFMGEEYGETSPFLYFISHSDQNLIEGVRQGRKKEFVLFNWEEEPPDPQSPETLVQSRITWEKRKQGNNRTLLELYKELIQLRKNIASLSHLDKSCLDVTGDEEKKVVFMKRWRDDHHILAIFNFNKKDVKLDSLPYKGLWKKILDSSDTKWNGPGTLLPESMGKSQKITMRKESFALYQIAGETDTV